MIRELCQDDLDRVVAVWLEASIQAHDFVECGFWESQASDMREVYLPSAETYVFEEDGHLKGFIALKGDLLAALFVVPRFQGKGIGSQLMAQAKKLRKKLCLTVYIENIKSVAFYKKCGFRIVRQQIDGATGHAELVMEYPV